MTMGLIRMLRRYSSVDEKTLAEALGISLVRYKKIEAGEEEPTSQEIEKLAVIFGVTPGFLSGEAEAEQLFALQQTFEEGILQSEELREAVKLRVTDLSLEEKKLIMMIRGAENSAKAVADAIEAVLKV